MEKIYTIQNEHGDEGFIQYFKDGEEWDEIIGWHNNKGNFNPEFLHMYCIITEKEYNAIKALHETFDVNNYSEIFDANELLITYTVERNRKNVLRFGHVYDKDIEQAVKDIGYDNCEHYDDLLEIGDYIESTYLEDCQYEADKAIEQWKKDTIANFPELCNK